MSKSEKKYLHLPSARYVSCTCPTCRHRFKLVINSNADRHEYIVNTSQVKETQCPLCLSEIRLNREYLFAVVTN